MERRWQSGAGERSGEMRVEEDASGFVAAGVMTRARAAGQSASAPFCSCRCAGHRLPSIGAPLDLSSARTKPALRPSRSSVGAAICNCALCLLSAALPLPGPVSLAYIWGKGIIRSPL